jgi:hypothetical protein
MGENITYIYYLFGRIVAPQPSQLSDLAVINALTPPRPCFIAHTSRTSPSFATTSPSSTLARIPRLLNLTIICIVMASPSSAYLTLPDQIIKE